MSSDDETEITRFSTPNFTTLLNKQLDRVLQAMSEREETKAFNELTNLILILPPKRWQMELVDEANRISDRLIESNTSAQSNAFDMVLLRGHVKGNSNEILSQENRPLFQKVLIQMHKHNLLVGLRRPIETNIPKKSASKEIFEVSKPTQ